MKYRIVCAIVLIMISLVMVACDANNNPILSSLQDNETEKSSDDFDQESEITIQDENTIINQYTLYDVTYTLSIKEMNKILEKKDSSIEIPINENGYTKEELESLIIATNVYVRNKQGNETWNSNGNIYDIDNDYVYIICTEHGIRENASDKLEDISVKFVTGETVDIDYATVNVGTDVALLVVRKDKITNETLSTIKTINISNLYMQNLIDKNVYILYQLDNKYYSDETTIIDTNIIERYIRTNSDMGEHGASGSGLFDIYGNYCGFITQKNAATYYPIFPFIYDEIVKFNENY